MHHLRIYVLPVSDVNVNHLSLVPQFLLELVHLRQEDTEVSLCDSGIKRSQLLQKKAEHFSDANISLALMHHLILLRVLDCL